MKRLEVFCSLLLSKNQILIHFASKLIRHLLHVTLFFTYYTSMVRLAHVFQSLFVVFDFHGSNAFVTSAPPPPSPSNCMMNLRNERNHIFEHTFPSLKPRVICIFVVTGTIFIFLLFRIFVHLCVTVKYVAFTTNLTLFRMIKATSALTPSSMTHRYSHYYCLGCSQRISLIIIFP